MNCPACGNANPDGAAFCGVCYEVLAKKAPAAASPAPPPARVAGEPGLTAPLLAAALAVFAAMVAARQRLDRAFWILDGINLAFHEGGHIVFGLLGNRFIMVMGGTSMQLLLPFAAALHFWGRREKLSACVALFWFGQNFLGIGRYIADARAQQLDLVAGGVHDWTYLLETVGLLIHDEGLGKAVEIAGCLIMTLAMLAWYMYFMRARAAKAEGSEEAAI